MKRDFWCDICRLFFKRRSVMTSMRECLRQTGLVSDSRFRELEEADRIRDQIRDRTWYDKRLREAGRAAALDGILSAKTVKDFRQAARFALTHFPDLVGEVVVTAHALKCERGGKSLVWQIYQIRDHLPSLGEKDRGKFLENAFGKNGLGYLTVRKNF